MGKGTNQIATFEDLQSIGYRIPLSVLNAKECVTYNDINTMNNEAMLSYQTLKSSDFTFDSNINKKLLKWSTISNNGSLVTNNTALFQNILNGNRTNCARVGIQFRYLITTRAIPSGNNNTVVTIRVKQQLSNNSFTSNYDINLTAGVSSKTVYFPIGINSGDKGFFMSVTPASNVTIHNTKVSTNYITQGDLEISNGNMQFDIYKSDTWVKRYTKYHEFVRDVFDIVFYVS